MRDGATRSLSGMISTSARSHRRAFFFLNLIKQSLMALWYLIVAKICIEIAEQMTNHEGDMRTRNLESIGKLQLPDLTFTHRHGFAPSTLLSRDPQYAN
jgi:hypothetical protein